MIQFTLIGKIIFHPIVKQKRSPDVYYILVALAQMYSYSIAVVLISFGQTEREMAELCAVLLQYTFPLHLQH